ncbi:hypothetical protein ACEWY4_024456 [Coilia grayii]|uniref:HAT C-terminal dimerisation domain-containing protein n=1 Tax=Coilia grayii TaxID=363190 RepID=A0ABD1J0D6_9TELE
MFHLLCENDDDWDNDTRMMAVGYEGWLSKASTCFLLMTYGEVFNATDALFSVLQNKSVDIAFCCQRISDTMAIMCRLREDFDSFYIKFEERCQQLGLSDASAQSDQPIRDRRRLLFYSILENICIQMKTRFAHYGKLSFIGLVDTRKFEHMSKSFDEGLLKSLAKAYLRYFDFVRLKADLTGLYSSQMIRQTCATPAQLLDFLHCNDLVVTVPEASKLLSLDLTLPATTASVERSFSALKRIKTYSRNRTGEERLSSLALISIESAHLMSLKKDHKTFYNDVIKKFVEKDRRMDFIFK